jgi:hypothetical protein
LMRNDWMDWMVWILTALCVVVVVGLLLMLVVGWATGRTSDLVGTVQDHREDSGVRLVGKVVMPYTDYFLTVDGVEYECDKDVYETAQTDQCYTFDRYTDAVGTDILVGIR